MGSQVGPYRVNPLHGEKYWMILLENHLLQTIPSDSVAFYLAWNLKTYDTVTAGLGCIEPHLSSTSVELSVGKYLYSYFNN